jgi:hypothetical protein
MQRKGNDAQLVQKSDQTFAGLLPRPDDMPDQAVKLMSS